MDQDFLNNEFFKYLIDNKNNTLVIESNLIIELIEKWIRIDVI